MNLKVKNKTLFLCLPALLNMPFFGLSAFGANTEKGNDKGNGPKRPNILVLLTDDQTSALSMLGVTVQSRPRIWTGLSAWYIIHPNSRNGRFQWCYFAAQPCNASYRAWFDGYTSQWRRYSGK